MANKELDSINGTLVEMRVIAEGAISLHQNKPKPDAETYNLIGEALYMLQERISYCLLACHDSENGL